ncbi:MAG: hypothetical protein JWR02_711 [Mucilaginibacter sp.]|nr:hypothetical protein [Mucilaginibacter sp.]
MNFAVISYLYIVFFVIAYLADYLPFFPLIKNISSLNKVSIQTIRANNIDDPEKEKILLNNSLQLFKQSLKLLGLVGVIALFGFVLLLASNVFRSLNQDILLRYIATLPGLLLSVIAFATYFLLKKLYVKIRL